MTDRFVRACRVGALLLSASLLLTAGGCSVLNPSLATVFGVNATGALEGPGGSLIILVMNRATGTASARIALVKDNGGTLELTVPVDAFDASSESDHTEIVQDCDVASVQLLDVTVATGVGDPVLVPSDTPPLVRGVNMFCGNVVSILITGSTTPPVIAVY
jgi:hypothetical protein